MDLVESVDVQSTNSYYVHPLSLNERRKAALEVIDNARFKWFHFKVCMVAGLGFFTDAYNIFAISIASTMIAIVSEQEYSLKPDEELGLKMATLVGALFGQLLFGWLADRAGRKSMYGIELIIMTISTFGQALSGGTPAVNTVGVVTVWRFIVGLGIGGDYPLSAVIVSESVPTYIRGRLMTLVVASQGWGNLAAALTAMASLHAFRDGLGMSDPKDPQVVRNADHIWRLIVGLGCIPAVIGIYFRFTIPETPRFTMDIDRNLAQAEADIKTSMTHEETNYSAEVIRRVRVPKPTWNDFIRYFSRWENLRILIGVAYSWFAIDITFYGINLNSTDYLQAIIFRTPKSTVYEHLRNIAATNAIASLAGFLPGYYATFLLVDSWGRKPIQFIGFVVLAILFIITGAASDRLRAPCTGNDTTCDPYPGPTGAAVGVLLYSLINFFQNFGPNTTTFIISGELFPTRYRSTCHGIAGACGKLGATISLAVFYAIQQNYPFPNHFLVILAFFMFIGIGSTLWIPETMDKSLEELSNEDQEEFVGGYGHDDRHLHGQVNSENNINEYEMTQLLLSRTPS